MRELAVESALEARFRRSESSTMEPERIGGGGERRGVALGREVRDGRHNTWHNGAMAQRQWCNSNGTMAQWHNGTTAMVHVVMHNITATITHGTLAHGTLARTHT